MKTNISSRKGFSLVEVVIAIGIVAVLLTTFMAVFGPAQKKINQALGVAEANRLVATLENEMAIYRDEDLNICEYSFDLTDEDGNVIKKVSTPFEKSFQWIKGSNDPSTAIVVYQYQAWPDKINPDGTLTAIQPSNASDPNLLPGKDYVTQTVARRTDNSSTIANELEPGVVAGNVYAVRVTQLVSDGTNGLVIGFDTSDLNNAGRNEIYSPAVKNGDDKSSSEDYEDAVITLQVEFFQLKNNLNAYVTNGKVTGGSWSFDKLGTPVATQNIAVRR